jgi:hypothetical protein
MTPAGLGEVSMTAPCSALRLVIEGIFSITQNGLIRPY